MNPGPSKLAEALVAILLPPACREEVLGDLHERYQSPGQYALDALTTVPLVILSRVRRTADPQMVLIQAFVIYLSFLGAAWWQGAELLREDTGLARLAIPGGLMLLGLLLGDAYARPGDRQAEPWRGPLFGIGLILMARNLLAVDGWVLTAGCGLSSLLSVAFKIFFVSPGKLPGLALLGENSTRGREFMNPKVIFFIVAAFLIGLTVGVVAVTNHHDASQLSMLTLLINGMPFLLLLTFWVVLMVLLFKVVKRLR